jgi:anti-sigma B factor antagonist
MGDGTDLHWTPGTTPIAHVSGEIDLANATGVFAAVRAKASDTGLVIDLSEVTFVDSSGLGQLVALSRDVPLRVVAPRAAAPRRTIEITQLAAVIPLFETVEAALASA